MEAERVENSRADRAERSLLDLFTEQFFDASEQEPPFAAYADQLCNRLGKKRWQVIARAGIDRTYGYQLFNGTRRPSRDKVIQLAFGMDLDLLQTQELLRAAEKNALDRYRKRDAVFIFCLEKRKNIYEAQKLLDNLELPSLELLER